MDFSARTSWKTFNFSQKQVDDSLVPEIKRVSHTPSFSFGREREKERQVVKEQIKAVLTFAQTTYEIDLLFLYPPPFAICILGDPQTESPRLFISIQDRTGGEAFNSFLFC